MLFHTSVRNTGLFLTLSFSSLAYYHNTTRSKMKGIILFISFIFNIISLKISYGLIQKTEKQIPKLLLMCNIILLVYYGNILLFKKK